MAEFRIQIIETSARVVEVEADGLLEALTLVEEQWDNGDILLDAEDFCGVFFEELDNAIS